MNGIAPVSQLMARMGLGESTSIPEQSGLDDDTAFDILGNERRRACLKRLAQHNRELAVSDLGQEVARDVADADTDVDEIYNSVYISLCQSHLPRLASVDLVEYDHEEKRVAPGPAFSEIEHHLQVDHDNVTETAESRQQLLLASLLSMLVLPFAIVSPPSIQMALLLFLLALHFLTIGFEFVPRIDALVS